MLDLDYPMLDAPFVDADGDKLFQPECVLGFGAHGLVEMGTWLPTKHGVAVKTCMLEDATVMQLRTEARVMRLCAEHPFVVKLVAVMQTECHVFFVMAACTGGDLYNRFHFGMDALSKSERMKHALFYLKEVVCALEQLHDSGIVHSDLKVENILIDAEGHVRLCDMGSAMTGVQPYRFLRGARGSPMHFPPEMLRHKMTSFATDMWTLGCVAFELFTDSRPVEYDVANGVSRTVEMLETFNLGADADDFVRVLLNPDPAARPSVKQVKSHRLFAGTDWDAVRAKQLPVPWVPEKAQVDAECKAMAALGLPPRVALFANQKC